LNLSVNDPVKAQEYLERSISLTQELRGRTSVEAAAMTGELGLAYSRIGNYERAQEKFSAALAILDAPQSGRPLELAALLTYHGEFLRDQNRWNDAYENFKRAAELREKVLGEHPMVATAYQLCAAACRKLKRKNEAKSYEAKAQEIVESFPQTQLAANTVDVKMLKSDRASGFVSGQH
jgi:tetratricopeptide (TPR) repeat protein